MLVPSFPLRLDASGRIAMVEQGGDEHAAELIAHLLLTRKGERPLVPTFGVTDPTFSQVDEAELTAAVAAFGPEGRAPRVESVHQVDERTAAYTLTIERA